MIFDFEFEKKFKKIEKKFGEINTALTFATPIKTGSKIKLKRSLKVWKQQHLNQ